MKLNILLALLLLTACSTSHIDSTPTMSAKKTEATSPFSPTASYQSQVPARGLDYGQVLERISFSSCFNQDLPAPLWKDILDSKSDLFLFMGDNIYGSSPHQKPLSDQYRKADQNLDYKKLRETVPILATWDDHDYGERDGGSDWGGKDNARRDFLNYWSYARNSMPLDQPGIYHSKMIGPKNKVVQVIMLDTRYNRSPLKQSENAQQSGRDYLPNQDGTILGEAQWNWLELQLKKPAKLRFVVSSIQLIADEPPFEKWSNFPKERQRFFELLQKTRVKNVIVLSGDRHMGSISKMELKGWGSLHEITASSINRPNSYTDQDRHYIGEAFNGVNYGLAQIDWQKKKVAIELRTSENKAVNQVEIFF